MSEFKIPESETPKPTRPRISATSTVDRSKQVKNPDIHFSESLESSLGLLSLNSVNFSNIFEVSTDAKNPSQVLEQQRKMANTTLQRAEQKSSRVGSVPSKLLKPAVHHTKNESNFPADSESTVSDSDLLLTPTNTSTPRSSTKDIKDFATSQLRDSISHFTNMLDSNVSLKNIVEEITKATGNRNPPNNLGIDSGMFLPSEDAASLLLADEMSWKKKYDVPASIQESMSFQDLKDVSAQSIGEFFQQRSDTISDLRAASPSKSEPVALIETSSILSDVKDEESIHPSKSLSISAIQQLLEEAEATPNKVINFLLNQKGKKNFQESMSHKEESNSEIFSLPVSRNTSYTTSFSDNEAIKVLVNENKENLHPSNQNKQQSDSTSSTLGSQEPKPFVPLMSQEPKSFTPSPSRTSSSLTSLPNGKIPIESTKTELVWGCVKVDKCVSKEFLLRNKTSKTLRLQCSLSTCDFKIRKDNRSESDTLSACKFVLHGHESRALVISFIPTKIGAAVDELSFAPLDANLTVTKKQCIRLWGYGGYTNIGLHNTTRDNTGKFWLSLGRMDNRAVMEQSFTIKNSGNLPSFVHIKVIPKHFITTSNLTLEPKLFVLLQNEEKTVKLTYIPTAKDGRILKQNLNALHVTDIGRLEIISGPEVSRARLRRLYRKSAEKGLAVDPLCKVLKEKISNEVFPGDMLRFKENPSAIPDILETFTNDEIVMTVERDPNQTLVAEYAEDSAIFQSLCHDSTVLANDSELTYGTCRLEPPSIILSLPNKTEDCLYLISESNNVLHFEVSSTPDGLHISPKEGDLFPGKNQVIKVKMSKKCKDTYFKVVVYIENDIFECDIKILTVTMPPRSFLE